MNRFFFVSGQSASLPPSEHQSIDWDVFQFSSDNIGKFKEEVTSSIATPVNNIIPMIWYVQTFPNQISWVEASIQTALNKSMERDTVYGQRCWAEIQGRAGTLDTATWLYVVRITNQPYRLHIYFSVTQGKKKRTNTMQSLKHRTGNGSTMWVC